VTQINPVIQEPVRSDAASDGAGARRPAALVTNGLSKRYGRRLAVDALSIEVPAGVVAGFIGPNGAGKTTTMAMLLGLVRPTAGTATVLGANVEHPASYLGRVGALIEAPSFWPGLSGVENLGCCRPSAATTLAASPRCSTAATTFARRDITA
jgi:ABC-2 type transport system ATP-binding protein